MSETFQVSINKDTNDELNNYLDDQSFNDLKEHFPDKVDEVFVITKNELADLKESIQQKNNDKILEIIRKNLIEDDIDWQETGETDKENQATLETLTIWTKSERIKLLSKAITWSIIEKLKPYPFLTDSQRINIITWITAKILNSWILETAFWWILNSMNNFVSNIKKWEFWKAIEGGKSEIEKMNEFENILDNNMQDILFIIDKNKHEDKQANLEWLLNNPQAIETANKEIDLNIEIEELKWDELKNYLLWLNKKIIGYDKKLLWAEDFSSNVVNILSNSPEFLQEAAKWLLDLLLKIPFLWGILAAIMWYWTPEEALEWFWDELKFAKSTKALISHWWSISDSGMFSNSNNSLAINELKNKNLTDLKYKNLTPFFKECKDKSIDYTTEDFWYKLFNTTKIDSTKEKALFELSTKFNSNKISNDDFSNKKPKQSFYDKLNNLNKKDESKTKTEAENDNTWDTIQELESKKTEIKNSMITVENFSELSNWLLLWDLYDLKNDISIEDLLSDNYKDKIKNQIWKDDYKKIKQYIVKIREKLQKSWIVVNWEIDDEDISDIKFWELINPESDIYKKLYQSEAEQIIEIDNQIQEKQKLNEQLEKKQEEILLISSKLNSITWDFTEFEYEINNKTITVKFDEKNQTISINNKNYNIKLKLWYKIKTLKKENNNIILTAQQLIMNKKTIPTTIDKFAEQIYILKHSWSISFQDEEWENIWTIAV